MTKLTSKLVSAKVKGGPGSFADGTFEDSEDKALEVIEEFYPEAHTHKHSPPNPLPSPTS